LRHDLHFVGEMNENFNVPEVLLLGGREIKELLSMGEALKAVEQSFRLQTNGKTIMPPKLYLDLPQYQGDFRAMPAYVDGAAGVKWVSVYPDNWRQSLPSIVATIILCDPSTGYPLAIMDATYITNIRTGAAGGVAVKYLARKDSTIIGFVGAGVQAKTQLLAIIEVLPQIKEVKVFDLDRDISQKYVDEMTAKLGINIHPVETIQDATEADIIVATTPSRKPVVRKQYIKPGTHINAIGADAKGKQELEADLLRSGKIIVDDIEQASHSGEINVPLSGGIIKIEDIYGTLGEVVASVKKGREDNEEITIFDSTGLAIEDVVCAKIVYEKAKKRGVSTFEFL
jgi:alanine dehydrogenase